MHDIAVAETILSVAWSVKRDDLNPDDLAGLVIRDLGAVKNEEHRRTYAAGLDGLHRALSAVIEIINHEVTDDDDLA